MIKVSQDELYEYFLAHDIKLLRLSELMGVSDNFVTSCFAHSKDSKGVPRSFSPKTIELINEALPQLASRLDGCQLEFGSPKTYTNNHGRTYDPGLIEPIKTLGRYLNITGLVNRLLGWSQNKKSSILSRPNALNYGNITMDDVMAINNEIQYIVDTLNSLQLVIDKG